MSRAELLLVNNNNSRTKFALAERDSLTGEHRVIDTLDLSGKAVFDLLEGWEFERIVTASVVPEKGAALRSWLSDYPTTEISHEIELGIAIDFPNPSTIGADRLANAAAVCELFGESALPIIVVDFGTAVTFDIIATHGSRPAYIGGVIAPGLDSMRDYLHQRTALLPRIDLREPPAAIGKSTEDAMLSGAVYGYRGLVREILSQIGRELKADAKIIATGGHAELIAAGLPEIESVHPVLTMDGLRIIGGLNFSR
ncbi:MAG: type III pantothenate kinase [Verrucomicrobiales bacterium]|nr:type III pantothenate kinase [Verrucomicrobiales bacterium]